MNPYITDTEYAAKGLFELALSGDAELKRLSQALQSANAGFAMNFLDAASIESDEDLDPDEDSLEDQVNAAYARAGQFHQYATALKVDIERLDKELVDKDTALQTLSGAILHIAKQGLSIVHGGPQSAPVVRVLAPSSLALPTVIWEGRNQAIHYEECQFRPGVEACFRELQRHFGPQFDLAAHSRRSRARQVLQVLGWSDYVSYLKDMQALLPRTPMR